MKKLMVFDFDGTLYEGDSLLDFAKFCSKKQYYKSLLIIVLPYIGSKFGIYSRDKMKITFLRVNFSGYSKQDLYDKGQLFFEVNKMKIFKNAFEFIKQGNRNNWKCIIVSASCEEWLRPFSDYLECDLVATKLKYTREDYFSGKFEGKNCVGEQKIYALKSHLDLADFSEIEMFGNAESDRLFGQIATNYHHRYFK